MKLLIMDFKKLQEILNDRKKIEIKKNNKV